MSPQKENGYTPIAHDLFEAFYRCKMTEYERCVVMCIWRKTYGWSKKEDWISNSQIHEETGIALPNITRTLKLLKSKNVISKNGKKVGVNKRYQEWKVEWRKVISSDNKVISPDNKKLSHQIPTKERKQITKTISKSDDLQDKKSSMETTYNPLGAEVIKAMESIDPKNKKYYGNKTQRAACDFLIEEYGLQEVTTRILAVEKTNGMPYFPTITTPVQLRDKWVQLENAVNRKRTEVKSSEVIW